MGRFAHLVMVSSSNNNKFYKMTEQPDGTFDVEYGRVDSTSSHTSYPMRKWDSTIKSKLRKGYKDITDLVATEEVIETTNEGKEKRIFISDEKEVENLIKELQAFAKATIQKNYRVSSQKVTQKMVDAAQTLIDELSNSYKNGGKFEELNEIILQIYTTIPRKMKNVRDHLLTNDNKEEIEVLIDNEQKLLDTMAGQVMANIASGDTSENLQESESNDEVNLLEQLGLEISLVNDNEVLSLIRNMMGDSANLMGKVFEVHNKKTENTFNKVLETATTKETQLLWHGSRNQNWFNILQTGLLIRPSGAICTGSMFGDGIYFANKARKSIGYTSLHGSYWAGGSDKKSFLALFNVNLGNIKHVHKHTYECYSFSKKTIAPHDSVYAHGGIDLRNDEFIVYESSQCTIKYLVEIK